MALIEINQVTKQYNSASGVYRALQDINLKMPQGQMLAVVGKSGSGKSTLLNLLTGIDHPSSGTVRIKGIDIHALGESDLARWRGATAGIVFQFFQLIPTLSVLDNLVLAMNFVGVIPKRTRVSRARDLLSLTGVIAHEHKLPTALSGGEQQRVAIARALANDPPIVVADEPTGNLDSVTSASIQALLCSLAKNGKTVIVVTHDSTSHVGFQRVITLRDGKVESDREVSE